MENRAHAIEAQVRSAVEATNKTGLLRKETLSVLIRATHSASNVLKTLAADNIQYLFQDFPEQEEQAINAIYDLCEDQDQQIRIRGYKAISRISRIERRLVKRNADVLLQLLQSDEPEEVSVVKSALLEHLEMDRKGTLSVLRDQLASVDSDMDEEERDMRERLRSLVSSFLTNDAFRSLDPESLVGVVPYLSLAEAEHIVHKLPESLGKQLLQALLERVTATLGSSFSRTRPELELAQNFVLKHRMTGPLELLRYYRDHLTKTTFLDQLTQPDREWLLGKLASVLSFVQRSPSDQELLQTQWGVVTACPYLLEFLIPTMMGSSAITCATLLRTCLLRKNSTQGWMPPSNLVTILHKMKRVIDDAPPQESKRELQKTLMFLLPTGSSSSTTESKRKGRVMQTATRSVNPKTGIIHDSITGKSWPMHSEDIEPRAGEPHPPKKRKSISDSDEASQSKHSLLSRLQMPAQSQSRGSTPRSATSRPATPSTSNTTGGFSIKGAASASAAAGTGGLASPTKRSPPTLLERLQSTTPVSPASPMDVDAQNSFGHRKRKRGPNR